MLDEEFDSLDKISRASDPDVESTRRKDLDGCSEAPYICERSAYCDRLALQDHAKVTATAYASEALGDSCWNACSTGPEFSDGAGVATVYIEDDQGSTLRHDSPSFGDASKRGSVAMIEDNDRFTNVEESFDQDYLEERELEGIGSISEYNSFGGRDTDNDDSSSFGGSPSKYLQTLSKSKSNSDQFYCNSDDEIAFGGSDWNEYLHQNETGLDSFIELQGSKDFLTKLQTGFQLNKSRGDFQEKYNDVSEHEDKAESDQLAEETLHGSRSRRLHSDDDDDYNRAGEGESSVAASLSTKTTSPALHANREIRVSMFQQDEDLVDCNMFWDMTSGSDTNVMTRDTENSMVAVQGQFEMQSTEELKILAVQDDSSAAASLLPSTLADSVNLNDPVEVRSVDEISKLGLEADCLFRTEKGTSVVVMSSNPDSKNEVDFKLTGELLNNELSQLVMAESHVQEDVVTEVSVEDSHRYRVHNVDLSPREFEALVQIKSLTLENVEGISESAAESSLEDESKRAGVDWAAEYLGPDELSRYVEALEVKETYIDTVLDMEDVLFDGEGGGGSRSFQSGKVMSPGSVRPVRDGSLTASTSSAWALASRQADHPTRLLTDIDWVEIVGAVQRNGGASLGERVVGVKQYTLYRIKVNGGGKEWEIQRRYRDFVVLYSQLQSLFAFNKNVTLPSPWEKVKQESRKYFGNTSPDVVEIRSSLIQACLQSLIRAGPPLSTATPLQRFLFPVGESCQTGGGPSGKSIVKNHSGPTLRLQELGHDSPTVDISGSITELDNDGTQSSVLGKTIRLIVQIHKKKSVRQQLQAQHYSCAGCYKHLELALGIVPELVQNWGWRGPRLCEYSGQLFCSTCHLNETAVLPAWVLQQWDFTPRLVSQLAKAYLDSIYDKPMLCVSAINPYLYARVPVLAHLTEMRRKISKMLACIRCPARTRIQTMLGSRRYLLENNDFCALRDLVDLSKGAFAGYMRAILMKLSSHIKRECFLCRELGEACGAGEICHDPYDVIYPHQDELIIRCPSCQRPFHKSCYRKCRKCPSCRGQPKLTMEDSSLISDKSCEHDTVQFVSQSTSTESVRRKESLTSTPASASENKSSARRGLLASFLGSLESRSGEKEKDILNMNPLSSSLDL